MHGRSGTREVINLVDFYKNGKRDIMAKELEIPE
jgi:hypothetical protein